MPAYNARVAFEAQNITTGLLITNVLHVEVDTLSSPPNWTSIAGDIYTWLGQLWLNGLATEDQFVQLVVTDENYPGSTFGQGVHVVGLPGTRAPTDGRLNRAICAVVSWKTATAKRYARGHTFMWPVQSSTECSANGQLNSTGAYASALGAFASAYVAGHTAGSTSYTPIIYSRTRQARGQTPFTFPVLALGVIWNQHWLSSRSAAP